VKIETVARLIDSSNTTVRRLVKRGVIPAPFRLTPKGPWLWPWPDTRDELRKRAGRALAA
jgi:hypothetical protein